MQSATTLNGGSYPAGGTGSRARDLGLRAQKKLLGRVVSTGAGRSLLIDDATTSLLDNLYKLMERAAKTNSSLDKKQPEKVLKNIVKLSIKVRVLLSILIDISAIVIFSTRFYQYVFHLITSILGGSFTT